MKGLVLAVIALVLPAAVQAESLPVRLKDGATWTITATHVRLGVGTGAQNWTLTTVKNLTWRAGRRGRDDRLTVSPVSATASEGSAQMVARARSFPVPATIEVDVTLASSAFVDVDAVSRAFREVHGRNPGGSEELIDAGAIAMIAREVDLVAIGQGTNLELGIAAESDAEIENPFDGKPIMARNRYVLESYDAKAGRAAIVWRGSTDMRTFVRGLAESLAEGMKSETRSMTLEEIQAVLKDASATLESACRHEIDISTGLAVKVDCRSTNTITILGETRGTTDTWTITQTLPEPR